jgi:hypothetical protein
MKQLDIGTQFGFLCGFIGLVMLVALGGCNPKQPDARNRVPNFSVNGQELADLKQQLADTKAAAQQAQQAAQDATKAKNDMQAQLEQLAKDAKQPDNQKPAAPADEPKEGRLEQTRPGIITDFGAFDLGVSNVTDFYLGFNFTDRNGFTKRFYPVCTGQTVKTGVPITIMYHWRSWQENQEGKRGCFQIDGFQTN